MNEIVLIHAFEVSWWKWHGFQTWGLLAPTATCRSQLPFRLEYNLEDNVEENLSKFVLYWFRYPRSVLSDVVFSSDLHEAQHPRRTSRPFGCGFSSVLLLFNKRYGKTSNIRIQSRPVFTGPYSSTCGSFSKIFYFVGTLVHGFKFT